MLLVNRVVSVEISALTKEWVNVAGEKLAAILRLGNLSRPSNTVVFRPHSGQEAGWSPLNTRWRR
jgi:hypothetical protein